MNRWTRWIIFTAAATGTMLSADMALADVRVTGQSNVTQPNSPYVTIRFDLLSPQGTSCQTQGTAAGSDLLGRPYMRGLSVGSTVLCTAADGRRFGVGVIRDPRDPLAVAVDVIVADRPGKSAPMMMVQANSQIDPLPVRGNASALAQAVR